MHPSCPHFPEPKPHKNIKTDYQLHCERMDKMREDWRRSVREANDGPPPGNEDRLIVGGVQVSISKPVSFRNPDFPLPSPPKDGERAAEREIEPSYPDSTRQMWPFMTENQKIEYVRLGYTNQPELLHDVIRILVDRLKKAKEAQP